MNTKTLTILVTGVIVGAGIFASAFYFGMKSKEGISLSTSPTPVSSNSQTTVTPLPTTITQTQTKNGFVEGSLSYPSGGGIPKNIQVCAETTQGFLIKCTNTQIPDAKYQYGIGYNLELPEGGYYVYATTDKDADKVYYTEFVTCGLKYECPSHEKIEVVVKSGETTSNIDPGDWYNQAN